MSILKTFFKSLQYWTERQDILMAWTQFHWPFLTHYSPVLLIIFTENIRKPKGFRMFSRGIEKQHRAVVGTLSCLLSILRS